MGSINIDNTGSGGAITLSSDGTSLLLGGSAVGGNPDLYRDNASSPTTPLAGGANGVAIGSGSNAGGSGAIALGVGSAAGDGAFCAINGGGNTSYGAVGNRSIAMGEAARAQGQDSVAIGENSLASSADSFAIGRDTDATANNAAAFGYLAQAAGANSIALGIARAGGSDSFAASVQNNTSSYGATGAGSVAIGHDAKATGSTSVAIGEFSVSTGTNSFAGPRSHASGTGSFAAANGQTTTSYGAKGDYGIALGWEARADTGTLGAVAIGHGADTRGTLGVSLGNNAYVTASATRAVAIGYNVEVGAPNSFAAGDAPIIGSSGTSAVALGTSYANAEDAFAAAITNNTSSYGATGPNSIAIGSQAKATAADAVAIGDRNEASGNGSVALAARSTASGANSVSIGFLSDATGPSSVALGSGYAGSGPQATFYNSIAIGAGSLSDKIGKVAISGHKFSSSGDGQHGIFVLRVATTNATATPLITGPDYYGSHTPDDENQVILPNNSAYAFHGTIVARQQAADGTACAAWKVEGLIRREGSAGTTVLVNSATTVLDNTPNWGMALSADTTNGGLKIEATGAASTDIRWVATIHTSEVTYA